MAISELRKALTTTGSGANLIAEDLERSIRSDLQLKSPMFNWLDAVRADGNVHSITKRTARGNGAWFRGEMADVNYQNATYARRNVTVKIIRAESQVSNFQQSAARSYTDSLANEIEAASDDFREAVEFAALYGCADEITGFTGDAYQYNGIVPFVYYDDPTNCVFDVRGGKIALSNLDDALDITRSKYRNLQGGKWMWLMSSNMRHTVSGLQTQIRRLVPQIDYEGQFLMDTYEGVPIMESGFVAPNSTSASVTGLGATAAGTGTVAAGTYRYRIAALTLYGEQVTSATAAVTQSGTDAQTNLSWTANSDAKLYAIYRTAVNEADTLSLYDLLDIVAAKAYDSTGATTGNVTTYTDAFTKTTKANVHPLTLYDSSTKAMETMYLVYLDKLNGASLAVLPPAMGETYGGDPTKNLVRFNTLVETTSSFQFRLESFHVLQIPNAKVCAVIRGAQRNATA